MLEKQTPFNNMKYIYIAFAILIIYCNGKVQKPKQNLKYSEIFSVALTEQAFVAIKPDTVAYMSGYNINNSCEYALLSFQSDITKKK